MRAERRLCPCSVPCSTTPTLLRCPHCRKDLKEVPGALTGLRESRSLVQEPVPVPAQDMDVGSGTLEPLLGAGAFGATFSYSEE